MKVTNTIENALTGITIKLSIAEQMVLASLQDTLEEGSRPAGKRVIVQTETINNIIAFLSKLTGNTYDLKSIEDELFSAPTEDSTKISSPGKIPLTCKAD